LPKIQLLGLIAMAVILAGAGLVSPLVLSLATTIVLVIVALAEKGAAEELRETHPA
jgi:hypothetical protein